MENKLAWRLREASDRSGLSVSFLRKLIRERQLPIAKVGRATLILDSNLRDLLNRQVGLHVITPLSEEEKARRKQKREETIAARQAA